MEMYGYGYGMNGFVTASSDKKDPNDWSKVKVPANVRCLTKVRGGGQCSLKACEGSGYTICTKHWGGSTTIAGTYQYEWLMDSMWKFYVNADEDDINAGVWLEKFSAEIPPAYLTLFARHLAVQGDEAWDTVTTTNDEGEEVEATITLKEWMAQEWEKKVMAKQQQHDDRMLDMLKRAANKVGSARQDIVGLKFDDKAAHRTSPSDLSTFLSTVTVEGIDMSDENWADNLIEQHPRAAQAALRAADDEVHSYWDNLKRKNYPNRANYGSDEEYEAECAKFDTKKRDTLRQGISGARFDQIGKTRYFAQLKQAAANVDMLAGVIDETMKAWEQQLVALRRPMENATDDDMTMPRFTKTQAVWTKHSPEGYIVAPETPPQPPKSKKAKSVNQWLKNKDVANMSAEDALALLQKMSEQ